MKIELLRSGQYLDVTDQFMKSYVKDHVIDYQCTESWHKLNSHLKISYEDQEVYIRENCPFKFNLSKPKDPDIFIVYFINTKVNDNYYNLMKQQLDHLKSTEILGRFKDGLISKTHLFIVAISDNEEKIRKEINEICPFSHLDVYNEDTFEYRGIQKVYDLATYDNIILYFHSKGISRISAGRTPEEQSIFRGVIENWYSNLDRFLRFESIDKLGLATSEKGFVWYNFWWVRGSFVKQLEYPVISPRRHYYEDWLGRRLRIGNAAPTVESYDENCYNYIRTNNYNTLIDPARNICNIGTYFIPESQSYV